MGFITILHCFFLKHTNPNRLSKHFNAVLNVSLLLLLNIFTLIKILGHFSSFANDIFNRYGTILTIILFISILLINHIFRDKNILKNYQNIILDKSKMQLIYGYIIVTILLFLFFVLIFNGN